MAGAGSAVVRRQLGSKLRQLRLAAGKDVADVVTAGLASKAKMSRIEGGKGPVKIADVRALCWLYGASAETTEALAALAPGTQQEDWWETYENVVVPDWFGLYVGLEQSASRLRCFDPELVHGLLQTEDYARAVIESEDTLEPKVIAQRLQFRMDRQRRVLNGHPDLTVVLGAGALSLVVGSPDVMAAQLDHMRQLARDKVARHPVPAMVGRRIPDERQLRLARLRLERRSNGRLRRVQHGCPLRRAVITGRGVRARLRRPAQ